jgi:hypothetical protein
VTTDGCTSQRAVSELMHQVARTTALLTDGQEQAAVREEGSVDCAGRSRTNN